MVLDSQQLVKNLLSDYFFKSQLKNPRFSLRAYAKKLNVSSSALSEILRGKRKISEKKSMQYLEKICADEKSITSVIAAFKNSGSLEKLSPVQTPFKEIILSPENFHIMSDRIYFTVLALFRSKKNDIESIAKKLNIPLLDVQKALDELVKANILKKKNNLYFENEKTIYRTSEDFPETLMNKRKMQNLTTSQNIINSNSNRNKGYFTTVAVDKNKLDEIDSIVEDFIKRLSLYIRKPGSDDVYEINIDIFPWTI